MTHKIDYRVWMNQPLIWGERVRGRGLVWTSDANWFINDPLGPIPHLHEEASEIVYLAQGSMEIQAGGNKRIYNAGDFLLMPPNKFHDYWFKGEDPVCLFVVVAPNHKTNRWRTSDFPSEAHTGDIPFTNVFESGTLPSDEFFQCEKIRLLPGEADGVTSLALQDRIIYVVEGTAQLTNNGLTGSVTQDQYQYIPATNQHLIYNASYRPLTFLSLTITDPFTAHGTELD